MAKLAATLERRVGRAADRPSLWPVSPGTSLGYVAVVAFGVLLVTGIVLTVHYEPSTAPTTYHGSASLHDGRELPAAYASVVRMSEDVRGGLLVRRVHVAASHLLVATVILHLWRILATGAARRPRTDNHLVGVGLLLVTLGAMFTGELLPFTLVSGASLRIGHATMSSVPVVGETLALLVFGAEAPTGLLVERSFWLHVLLLPAGFLALLALHLWLVHRHTPTAPPGTRDPDQVRGLPLWPDLPRRLLVPAGTVVAVLLVSAAVVPWGEVVRQGPFLPAEATNTLHPPWPLFFLSGGLRILPPVDLTLLGVHVSGVLLAGVLLPGLLVGAVVVHPFVERRVLRDRAVHHVRDGLLAVPFRAATLSALAAGFLALTLAATVDVLAFRLGVPVELVVWAMRLLAVLGPPLAAVAALRACRRRARPDGGAGRDLERHGPGRA